MEQPAKIGVVEVVEVALGMRGIKAFNSAVLPLLCDVAGTPTGLIYILDPRLPVSYYTDQGLASEQSAALQTACVEWFERLLAEPADAPKPILVDAGDPPSFVLHPLPVDGRLIGMVGLAATETASILLLDEEKENFQFYRVEGSAKPLLGGMTFPVTEGVAGRVLKSLEAEIVNDAETDEQFYGRIDLETGFRTRNMIAVPLVAGDESIGVLEVLNHGDGEAFSADERIILVSVADEVAFAVRNATVFDYVINTYCKRRQGQNSCKGCERPLGSWTPCMRYREFLP